MLPLASLAARRLRTHHICATCRIASRNRGAAFASPALHLQYGHPRYFSATLVRADDNSEPSETTTESEPASPQLKKKKKKRQQPSPPAPQQKKPPKASKPSDGTETVPAKPAPKKKKQEGTARDLKVLQGALAALKNVLDAQNIDLTGAAKSERKREGKAPGKEADGAAEKQLASGSLNAQQPKKKEKKKSAGESGPARLTPRHLKALRRALASHPSAAPSETGAEDTKKAQDAATAVDKKPKAPSVFIRKTKSAGPALRGGAIFRKTSPKAEPPSQGKRSTALNNPLNATPPWMLTSQAESAGTDITEATSEESTIKKPVKKPLEKADIKIENIYSENLHLVPIEKKQPPVPPVSYGLDRVLFNPGVYHLQDPRSRVYNFDPYLSKIMPIQEFDFNALKQYITSSKDETLINIARENNKRYTGSTSSMTAMLAHFHYLLSSWREINPAILSKSFNTPSNHFTKILTSPAAIFLHWKDGVYAIDADKEFDTANILSMLGKSMEKLLTLSKEDYERYRTINSDQISEEERNADEAYHYTGLGDFMMRSQLDAHDPRVPGTGMFDLKTRAVISIRMDAEGFHKGLGYEIRNRFGDWQSFEREYYDMIRSAFLKYSLQVRMGLIPLWGDTEFKLSLGLLNDIMDRASKKFPEQSLRLHFETRPSVVAPFMYIFAKPVENHEIKEVQEANKAKIEEFERKVLGLGPADVGTTSTPDNEDPVEDDGLEEDDLEQDELEEALAESSETPVINEVPDTAIWEDVRSKVEDAMEDDELGVAAVREAIEDALEQSGLLGSQSPEDTRSYVDSLLHALSPDASPEQTEGVLADRDDAVDCQDHVEEQSTSEDVAEAEGSDESHMPSAVHDENAPEVDTLTEEKPVKTTDTAEGGDKDSFAQESRGDADAESDVSFHEATSDPSVSIPIIETSSPSKQEPQSEEAVAPEEDQRDDRDDSVAREPVSEESISAAELEAAGLNPDQQEKVEELKALSGTSSLSNLKDLIVRMAQNIDEREVSERDMDDEDDSKLWEFERVLGKMMADSKAASSSPTQATDVEDGLKESSDAATEPSALTAEPQAGGTDENAFVHRGPLLGMVLTVRNRVNGSYVERPEDLDPSDKWDIEYNIQEMPEGRAWNLYEKLMNRRKKALQHEGDRDAAWYEMFQGSLEKHTKAGRKFREEEDIRARQRPVHVVGETEARTYEDTFGADAPEEAPETTEADEPIPITTTTMDRI
ncbi:hypothetical protein PG994_014405 [Apiospora phragmitis]|uniref:Uncharacterized protein n=1 Tax=Apiospora phragmitis TaxID=2905665 RepID=A0ABR1T481_9PEZI